MIFMKISEHYKFSEHLTSIVSICLLLLSSCGAGFNSSSEELSGDYYFRESGNLNSIRSHNDLHSAIYSRIIAYDHNSDFIIAAQKPNLEHHRGLIASELNTGHEDFSVLEKSADSILKHDPYYLKIFSSKINFWIIVSKSHELIGPLTKDEYQAKRKELNIPDDLELDVKP
jgi:hypothetical protein